MNNYITIGGKQRLPLTWYSDSRINEIQINETASTLTTQPIEDIKQLVSEKILDTAGVAKLLKCSKRNIGRLIKYRGLPHGTNGRDNLFVVDDVIEWVRGYKKN